MPILVDGDQGATANDLQAAITTAGDGSHDGIVTIKGTIDFAGTGLSSVTTQPVVADVTIMGEPNEVANGTYPVITNGGGLADGLIVGALIIESPNHVITLQDLKFLKSAGLAIQVKGAKGLVIDHCFIQTVAPVLITVAGSTFPSSGGIAVGENANGNLEIKNNDIDIGGSDADRTFGIQVNRRNTGAAAAITISGNTVKNTTAHGIAARDVNGRDMSTNPPTPIPVTATIENNTIITGSIGGKPDIGDSFVDGIFCQGTGTYWVIDNPMIDCGFDNSAGIRLAGTQGAPITSAHVERNTIRMSATGKPKRPMTEAPTAKASSKATKPSPASGSPDPYFPYGESAGIELRRYCNNNQILTNAITGQGRAVLVQASDMGSSAQTGNHFENNTHNFQSFTADIFIDRNVTATVIVGGPGTILDYGSANNWGLYTPLPSREI